jgi:hypothetical protein
MKAALPSPLRFLESLHNAHPRRITDFICFGAEIREKAAAKSTVFAKSDEHLVDVRFESMQRRKGLVQQRPRKERARREEMVLYNLENKDVLRSEVV